MKSNKLIYFLIFIISFIQSSFILLSNNNSFDLIERTNNSVTFKYNNDAQSERVIIAIRKANDSIPKLDLKNKYKINDSVNKLSEFANIDNKYFILVDSSNFKTLGKNIISLQPSTGYSFDIYYINKESFTTETLTFNTLAAEPTKQANQIAFIGNETESITLIWTNGNGKGRVIFASMYEINELPVDGVVYKSSKNFLDSVSKIKNNSETYCVYNSLFDSEKRVTIKNVGYGDYFFRIFEFNGSADSINYLTSFGKSNPRNKFIYILKAPQALFPENVTKNSFDAKWEHVIRSQGYLLEVAEDEAFTKLFDIFNPADVGYCESINVDGLKPNTTYFYRLRTIGYDDISEYSNVIKVKTKK